MNTATTHDRHQKISTGTRLQHARRQLGLSQQEVAERLCLKTSIIRAIEEDQTPSDLSSTFLRGYIRSYAKLLRLSEKELLPMIEQSIPIKTPNVSSIQVSIEKKQEKYDSWLIRFTLLILLILIGLTGIWWWQHHHIQQRKVHDTINHQSATSELEVSTSSNDILSNFDDVSPIKDPKNITDRQFFVPSDTTKKEIFQSNQTSQKLQKSQKDTLISISRTPLFNSKITKETSNILSDANNRNSSINPTSNTILPINLNKLSMKFTADCWLEIIDATGKKLFIGLQHKDETLNLTGYAPFKFKIGAPQAIKIQYLGKYIDLSHFIHNHQIARLTLGAEQHRNQNQLTNN